jgi:hypothetical protein
MSDDEIDFTKDLPSDDGGDRGAEPTVRQQSWPCDRPAELEVTIDVGRIRVELVPGEEVRVEVRHDPGAGGAIGQGIGGLMNWLGSAGARGGLEGAFAAGFGDRFHGGAFGLDPERLAADAVRAAEISWSEGGRRLVVRSSEELPLRVVPLAVTVTAPAGSRLAARTGSGDVSVSGPAGWAAVRTGSGRVDMGAVDGDADVTTGSGDIDLGPVAGRGRIRTGSGGVRLAAVRGTTEVRASSGDVTVTEVAADLGVRTGSGEVLVHDARSGRIDLTTGSGDLRVAVHPGVAAELDLSSGSGRARSELDVAAVAPEQATALVIKGRTGSGDVVVTRAATVPA